MEELGELKLVIDPTLISEEFCQTPAQLAYWNEQYAESIGAHLRAKANVERVHAETYRRIRTEFEDEHIRVTEAMVGAAVEADSDYGMAREELINAEVHKMKLRGRVEAIVTKRDMLISLGAHIRAELSDPLIKKQTREKAFYGT